MDFGREICSYLPQAENREWLVTNGIGGFAMGTIPGLLTRRYHGLLIAPLKPPLGRTLLLTKIDETLQYRGVDIPIYTNRWLDGTIEPDGTKFLEGFRLEGSTPVWSFAVADALLEKRIWMERRSNTTYIKYTLCRASSPMAVSAKTLVNARDFHHTSQPFQWAIEVEPLPDGLRFSTNNDETTFYLTSKDASWFPRSEWHEGYYLKEEAYRGQNDLIDANFYGGHCNFHLGPGLSVTLVASTNEFADLDGDQALDRNRKYEIQLLEKAEVNSLRSKSRQAKDKLINLNPIDQMVLAADQFIVNRSTSEDPEGSTIIAGYPWFSDWGRDTMIALPGLTLETGRSGDAAKILRTFAYFSSQGQLPNRFPDLGEEPEYNTADATLWYFEAIRAYYEKSGDKDLIVEIFPILEDIVDWHLRGTRYNIVRDPVDGLIFAGQPSVQLTWMDAKVDDWVVTPRIGKPVEINALWYNAMRIMVELGQLLDIDIGRYTELAVQAQDGFERFWNDLTGCCFDVIDGPDGHDPALRPNQILAVSLHYSPLNQDQQRAVVDTCGRHLLTSFGLRSLAEDHLDYVGVYGGNQRKRDGAYHQGTVWAWLIGPYVSAYLKVYGQRAIGRSFLKPLLKHLAQHGIGSISEIFDGDPPFTPRGCPAQAWSVAEVLRVWPQLDSDL